MALNDYRKKIDALDQQMVEMLNARAELSKKIGEFKAKKNEPIYAPHREKQVFDKVKQLNKGPLSASAVAAVYREIMSGSLALEKPLRIATLGTKGSFTSIAAQLRFGSQLEYVACENIWEIFQQVEKGNCDYGVVPIENSTEGAVTHTSDLLAESELKICSQIFMKISNCLASKYALKNIQTVYAHPQVFGQCRNWLLQNLPLAHQITVASNTDGMMKALKTKNSAAIASDFAAKEAQLPILKKNIQDIAHNTTRFFVIAQEDAQPTGKDKTTIVFSIKDKPGVLYNMLGPFYKNKINLTKIESRPLKKKAWDYYFFVDFEGHRLDKPVAKALAQLEEMCQFMKILGSYPVM